MITGPAVATPGDIRVHELAMTERIAEIVLQHAADARSGRVTDVHLVIGELSGASGECVAFYWDILARGTPAEGAALHIRHVAFELECLDCARRFAPDGVDYRCPACAGARVRPVQGDELYVEAIEVTGESAENPIRGSVEQAGAPR